MSCYTDENDKILEGFSNVNVVRRQTGTYEVWCEDWELMYGTFPAYFSEEELHTAVDVAVRFYKDGEKAGQEYGKQLKAIEIKRALDLID